MNPIQAYGLLALAAFTAIATPGRAATPDDGARDRAASVESALRSADSLQTIGKWAESESLAVRALSLSEGTRSADSSAIAQALYLQARARYGVKSLRDSVALRQLARSIGIRERAPRRDLSALAASHSLAGRILADTDRPDSALHHYAASRALVLERGAPGADTLVARLGLFAAQAHRQLRRTDEAVASLEEALALETRARGPDAPSVATLLSQLGGARVDQARFDEARAALERSLVIHESRFGPSSYELVPSLILLSTVEHRTGDLAGSLDLLERARDITRRRYGENNIRLTPMLDNIAIRLFDFGDAAGAQRLYAQSVRILEASLGPGNSRTEVSRVFLGVSTAMLGDTAAARRHLTTAIAAMEGKPVDRNFLLVHAYRWYAHVLLAEGRLDEARASLNRGLAVLHSSPNPAPETLVDLCSERLDVLRAAGDRAGLDSTLTLAAALFDSVGRRGSVLYSMSLRGSSRAEEYLGRRDSAWAHALLAERLDHARLIHNARALSDRRALELAGGIGESLDLLISLARSRGPAERAVAWDRLIGWRGLVRDEAVRRRLPLAATVDSALRSSHREWITAQIRHARLEVVALSGGGLPAGALAAAQAEAEHAERRYGARLQAQGLPRADASPGWESVRAALAPGTALVSLVEVPARSDTARLLAFVAADRSTEPRLIDLGRSRALRAAVTAWRRSLSTPPTTVDDEESRRLGRRVREATWDRLAPAIGAARDVVIVPDGPLVDLPWAALPIGERAYLVERDPRLRVVDAERALLATPAPERHGLLAVGDPSFDDREGAIASTSPAAAPALRGPLGGCAGGDPLRLAPLPGARDEANRVAEVWDASHPDDRALRLIGAAAREEAFKRDAPGRAVIHLATHGVMLGDSCEPVGRGTRGVGGVDPISPRPAATGARRPSRPRTVEVNTDDGVVSAPPQVGRRVWIALAGANHARDAGADANEGLLTAGEVAGLDMRGVRCVVLSACQSGVGVDWPREGSLGMQRAFRLAGARSVVASQWAIGDESTREWMLALYRAWGDGATRVSEALVAADRAVLRARRDTRRSTHPFYWAAFTATGE